MTPPGRRVGQHDEIGQACFPQHLHGDGGARHLHEREDALLHARSAGGGEQDEGRAALHGAHHAADDRLAGGHAERAAHEAEVLGGGNDVLALEGPLADEDRVLQLGVALGGLEAVAVALAVAELQRIWSHIAHRHDLEFAAIEEMLQPLVRIHAHVMVGAGNDELVGLEVLVEDHLPGVGAFDPQIFGYVPLGGEQAANLGTDAVDPVHAFVLLGHHPGPR